MSEFSDAEIADLRCLVRLMIPASDIYKVPGADDARIFADIIKSFGRDLPAVHTALADLAARSGGSFAGLDAVRQADVAVGFREQSGTPLMFVFARGNPSELEAARTNLFNTLIGIAIFVGASLIAKVIIGTLHQLGVNVGSCLGS